MRWRFLCMLGALLAVDPAGLCAQEPPPELPGITVRPEVGTEGPSEPASQAAPSQAPPTLQSPFDLPLYPSLADLEFDGLDGITRSEKSLFDTPQLGTIMSRQELE